MFLFVHCRFFRRGSMMFFFAQCIRRQQDVVCHPLFREFSRSPFSHMSQIVWLFHCSISIGMHTLHYVVLSSDRSGKNPICSKLWPLFFFSKCLGFGCALAVPWLFCLTKRSTSCLYLKNALHHHHRRRRLRHYRVIYLSYFTKYINIFIWKFYIGKQIFIEDFKIGERVILIRLFDVFK